MINGTVTVSTNQIIGTLTCDEVVYSGSVSINQTQINGTINPQIFAVPNPILEQRVSDLESATDGLDNGSDFLAYYILSKN